MSKKIKYPLHYIIPIFLICIATLVFTKANSTLYINRAVIIICCTSVITLVAKMIFHKSHFYIFIALFIIEIAFSRFLNSMFPSVDFLCMFYATVLMVFLSVAIDLMFCPEFRNHIFNEVFKSKKIAIAALILWSMYAIIYLFCIISVNCMGYAAFFFCIVVFITITLKNKSKKYSDNNEHNLSTNIKQICKTVFTTFKLLLLIALLLIICVGPNSILAFFLNGQPLRFSWEYSSAISEYKVTGDAIDKAQYSCFPTSIPKDSTNVTWSCETFLGHKRSMLDFDCDESYINSIIDTYSKDALHITQYESFIEYIINEYDSEKHPANQDCGTVICIPKTLDHIYFYSGTDYNEALRYVSSDELSRKFIYE